MALQLVITNAGRAAVIDQGSGGFVAVRIASVGVSATMVNATTEATNLPGEVKRIATIAGEATAGDVTHLTITDESSDSFTVRSFALYLSNGTLFAIYGQADPIVQKSAQALLLLAIDVMLSNIPASAITFGNANFINPAATAQRAGVIEIADDEEELAAADRTKALTPYSLRRTIRRAIGTRPIDYDPNIGELSIRGDAGGYTLGYTFRGADGVALGGFGISGGGSSLPNYYYIGTGPNAANNLRVHLDRVSYAGSTMWHAANDGAGSGLDADLLDGQQGSWYADVAARLGFAPVQQGTGIGQSAANIVKIGWANGRLLGTVDTTNLGGFVFEKDVADVWRLANDGAGSGLDADLLDGQQGSWYSDIAARLGFAPVQQGTGVGQSTANVVKIGWANGRLLGTVDASNLGAFVFESNIADVWRGANDGAGSGLDADLLDGQQGSWYADVAARLGFAPVQQGTGVGQSTANVVKIGWANGRLLGTVDASNLGAFVFESNIADVWHGANDGAGSGLDADLLDGWHRDEIRDWSNLLNKPATYPVSTHTHGAADLAGAFPGSLSGNGYVVLPNGLILQWVTGAQQAASSEGTQYVAFPVAFNTCFQVIVSTQVASANIESHAIYQLISNTVEGATVMRQLVSASGADREPSWPRLFAIGR